MTSCFLPGRMKFFQNGSTVNPFLLENPKKGHGQTVHNVVSDQGLHFC